MKVNVFGRYIPVIIKELTGEDSDKLGYFDSEDKCIYIDTGSSEDINLLIHEIFHSLRDRLHLQMDDNLEEQLAQNVADVITDNFELILKDES